ncbi:putative armadillo-like helical, proteasome component Ecm29 [Helianthus annuus]|uniref:Armadillo-like helical, proteasome component Ecm29 n=1 Tax=Helianthus annuus TaxID=4232 RepID=A0A251T7Y0_HELAN|nr:proteasome adapter and scaffold protein ECM29 [Helianthus annuus]KAF5778932.1 putative armadillo-like helical, proteasome component Ecm29 [Helianthus annuus]KAJ0506192.1 putative armadillo-like helical, proteasome component Ecm29 [Helianthus annuus]KAJ0675863.1 putative armadillo-like helical, proteasome component Ecm29 [Helianthus annuus]KAJ0863668.1 putative armadillo-like helical, proteasome component Ecm29 [Helianthus annuus]KAJ0867567.1 putative armadillo-like helical, proteasome compo
MASTASGSTSGKSDVEMEEMLDRMLTRLALCDEPKLENLLSKLLPLTISSLSRSSSAVRTKVMEILSHVNKRVKHQQHIGLPLEELWQLYMENNAALMVRNFCIVYVEMAFDRVTKEKKENIAPTMIANISKLPSQHQDIILRMVLKVIGECHSSQISDEIAAKYRLINEPQDKEMFVEFCLHMLLYQPPSASGGSPPGLSVSQSNRVMGKTPLNHDMLLIRKLGLLNVVDVMELPVELVYPLYVAACADRHEPVIKRGEELLKKKASGVNLDDPKLINRLFLLFNGSVGAEHIAADSRVNPGNPALRVRLMSAFCRSVTAANSFPSTLQCIFGCIYGNGTTSRLKQLGMEFTVWVFKHAKIDQLKLMGPVILSGVLKSLDGYTGSESDSIARETKTFAFQAIGLLAKRLPQLFRDKIDMAVRLFNALKVESPSIRLIVQEATNSLAIAYKDAPVTVLNELESLVLENSQVEQGEVRFCAMRWATTLFDSQHCPSRFICMLGASDTKLDIREMALEGLFLGKDQGRSTIESINLKHPKLADMLNYIVRQQPQLLESSEIREERLLFPSQTYVAAIRFLLQCFEADVEQNTATERTPEFVSSLGNMCLLLEHAMAYDSSVDLHATASKALIKIGSHFPEMLASRYAIRVPWLKQLLAHVDLDTRECAARLLGIASCGLPISAASDLINELISSVKGSGKSRFEIQHGMICALGYVTANCLLRTPTVTNSLFQNTLKCLVDVVNSETATLASVAMQGLGHIGLCSPLPKLDHDSGGTDDVLTLLREKLSKVLSGDDIKATQRIVLSLGHMCVKESSSTMISDALDLIFSLARSKVEDVLFAGGEALSFLWGGVPVTTDMILKTDYTSLSMTSNYLMADISSAEPTTSRFIGIEGNEEYHVLARDMITKKLFDGLLYSTKKEERCSGTVWLVSLTMYCGRHPSIQKLLPDIQEAFSHLIGEQNELTQELASQGLSIVYELGDASMKKNLVNALVGTLTGTGKRKRAVKLAEDTEVFQEGSIGGTLSGGKLSTYKELCSLANEMGQPDLVYKFMDLANHQASLNSKRGAAFGFSKIAKLAGDALQPYLRQLVPRLVRYQYDPDKNVQDAMAHIWKSLVADSKKTIDEYLDLIIEDLLVQCGSRLWRSRESSCLALADLIQGRKFDQVSKHLKNIWTAAFRAMDDIKETVRTSGERLCRAVTSLTLRLCDISLTEISDARKAMDIVLPLLLTDGIMSKVDDIRKASITIVTKLAKGAGVAIRPHLSELVVCMLESLSSLEDQGLNYVERHAENAGIQTEKLENLRISIAKGSPLWETLNMCIEVVDEQSLEQLIPRLSQLVRSGVGLNTRVGVASFISLLVQKVGDSIKPFTSTLLRLLFVAVKEERSAASKRAFANACAFLIKFAAPSQVHKLIEQTAALHTGDRNSQIACAFLLKSYASTSSDILTGYYATVVPVIFLSRFEDDKNVSRLYEDLWEENMTSERLTLQLYIGEIVTLITEGIASSSWASKRKAAKAIVKLCEVLEESVSSYHQVLLTSLMKEVPGRIWEGKEDILEALSALCTSCHTAISAADPAIENDILSVVTSACNKKVNKFRDAAFRCLDKVLKAFKNPDFFGVVFPLLFEMCNGAFISKQGSSSLNGTDKTETRETEDTSVPHDKIIECITSCVILARLNDIIKWQKDLVHVYLNSLAPAISWIVKVSVFTSIKELCSRISEGLKDMDQGVDVSSLVIELFYSVSPKVIDCISIIKIAQVHIAASECLDEVTKLYRDFTRARGAQVQVEVGFKTELVHQWEIEKNEQAKSLMKNCIDIIDSLQNKSL